MITTDIANCFIDPNGILNLKFHCDRKNHLDLYDARILLNNCFKATNERRTPLLIDGTDTFGTISFHAGNLIATDPKFKNLTTARAIVVNSLANKLLVSFFSKFAGSMPPYKVFTDPAAAREWLLQLKLDLNDNN